MKVNVRYQKEMEEPVTTELELHKNNKGYNIRIEGKYYFPKQDNPVILNLNKFENRELWVVVQEDRLNYGNIAFAVPDYFIIPDFEKREVRVEKEIPLNMIDNPDDTYKWDYDIIGRCSSVEQTDKFIDDLEAAGCPDQFIKSALSEFYELHKG